MSMLITASAISFIFLLLVGGILAARGGAGTVAVASVVAFMFFGLIMSPALMLQALLTLVVAIGCMRMGARARTAFACAVVAALASFVIVLSWRSSELENLEAMRRRYPLESIAERLEFERQRTVDQDVASQELHLAPQVASRLGEAETTYAYGNDRGGRLRTLHTRVSDDFVLAQGFGPVRMRSMSLESIELPPATSKVPCNHTSSESEPVEKPLSWDQVARRPTEPEIRRTHERSLRDLLHPNRMGYVRDLDHVAGFEPHQFTAMPTLATARRETQTWQVVRMDLVGWLRHDRAVAYRTKNLARMDELASAPIRDLDDFERDAIEKLRTAEDVVFQELPGTIRMVGSLRANRACLECHAARRGELLGAISYDLAPRERASDPNLEPRAELTLVDSVAQAGRP